jgi:hypothetical protein
MLNKTLSNFLCGQVFFFCPPDSAKFGAAGVANNTAPLNWAMDFSFDHGTYGSESIPMNTFF